MARAGPRPNPWIGFGQRRRVGVWRRLAIILGLRKPPPPPSAFLLKDELPALIAYLCGLRVSGGEAPHSVGTPPARRRSAGEGSVRRAATRLAGGRRRSAGDLPGILAFHPQPVRLRQRMPARCRRDPDRPASGCSCQAPTRFEPARMPDMAAESNIRH